MFLSSRFLIGAMGGIFQVAADLADGFLCFKSFSDLLSHLTRVFPKCILSSGAERPSPPEEDPDLCLPGNSSTT